MFRFLSSSPPGIPLDYLNATTRRSLDMSSAAVGNGNDSENDSLPTDEFGLKSAPWRGALRSKNERPLARRSLRRHK